MRTILAVVIVLLLAANTHGGHLTEIHGERAVVFGGRTWTWDELQDRRAESPGRFDANHPVLGWALRNPDAAVSRRALNPERFDRYHPCLGWLIGGLCVEPPIPPVVRPPVCPPPIHVVPEPGSLILAMVAAGMVAGWTWLRGTREDGE